MDKGERQDDEAAQALEAAALEPLDAHGDEADAVGGHDPSLDLAPCPDVGQGDLRGQVQEFPADDERGIKVASRAAAADDDARPSHIFTVPQVSPRFWLMWRSSPTAASVHIREDRP